MKWQARSIIPVFSLRAVPEYQSGNNRDPQQHRYPPFPVLSGRLDPNLPDVTTTLKTTDRVPDFSPH
jgi:hypothetical protein